MNAYIFVCIFHQAECYPLTVIANKALDTKYTSYKANFEKAWKFVILVLVFMYVFIYLFVVHLRTLLLTQIM